MQKSFLRSPSLCTQCASAALRQAVSPSALSQRERRTYTSTSSEVPFRLAKHFARDSKRPHDVETRSRAQKSRPPLAKGEYIRMGNPMEKKYKWAPKLPATALVVDLDDGNHIPPSRSRHRIPISSPREKAPIRRIRFWGAKSKPHHEVIPTANRHVLFTGYRRVGYSQRPIVTGRVMTPSLIYTRDYRKSARGRVKTSVRSDPPEASPPVSAEIWAEAKPPTYVKLHHNALEDWNYYWETLPPNLSQKTQANYFFTQHAAAKFLQSVAVFRAFPESDVAEVAFVGRSNVGKSSLLNAIVNANVKALLARCSATPGFTKTMNLYGVGPHTGIHFKQQPSGHTKIVGLGGLTIVDMPGYGEGSFSEWGTEIMKYLLGRKQLRRVFVLIDAQLGITDHDRSLLASLRLGGVPHQVILSKLDRIYIPEAKDVKRFDGKRKDKLKPKGTLDDLRKKMEKIKADIQPPVGGGALGEILACSSEILTDGKRLGIDAVRFAILQAVGHQIKDKGSKAKKGHLVRTMKTN